MTKEDERKVEREDFAKAMFEELQKTVEDTKEESSNPNSQKTKASR